MGKRLHLNSCNQLRRLPQRRCGRCQPSLRLLVQSLKRGGGRLQGDPRGDDHARRKAVFIDQLAINCACVGGNSKTPLGVVSFAENLIMAAMGAALLVGG